MTPSVDCGRVIMRGGGETSGPVSALGQTDRHRTDRLGCVSMDTSGCSPFPMCWDRGAVFTLGPVETHLRVQCASGFLPRRRCNYLLKHIDFPLIAKEGGKTKEGGGETAVNTFLSLDLSRETKQS
ncbi:unnamed protein product [Arctogadus glacialis]